jgi:hypothetical protein
VRTRNDRITGRWHPATCPLGDLVRFPVRFPYFLCLLFAQAAHGQTSHPQPAPEDAVITINGFCEDAASRQANPCQTVITRAQFEQLTQALDPDMSPELRLKVAEAYARMLRMAAAAEQRGLDKTPAFAEELRYARLQLLSQDLTRALHQDAENIPDAEVEAYYRDNHASFEQATLARIFIPRAARGPNPSEEKILQLAADLRARAARGADPDQLETEAYTAAGIPGTAPHTRMENVRRATLPPSHEMVMTLSQGEVSELISDPDGGHFIYKVISKQTLSLQQAQPEIHKQLSDQRYREATHRFSGDVTFNDTYFATYATPHRHQRDRRDGQAQ